MKLSEAKELIRVALKKAEEVYAVSRLDSEKLQWQSKIEVLKTVTEILDKVTEEPRQATGQGPEFHTSFIPS